MGGIDYAKERYHRLKSEGLCTRCGKEKAIEGKTVCELCKVKYAKKSKQRYNYLKSKGRCTICGAESFEGAIYCCDCIDKVGQRGIVYRQTDSYKERNKDAQKQRHAKYKADGLCSICGSKRDDKRYKMCGRCRSKQRSTYRAHNPIDIKLLWREEGLCVKCGGSTYSDTKLCKVCYDKAIATLDYARSVYKSKYNKSYSDMDIHLWK